MVTAKSKIPLLVVYHEKVEFHCHFDSDHHPIVEVENQTYKTFLSLFEAFPSLLKDHSAYAKLANFIFKKTEYLFIEDIAKYQEEYLERVEYEKNTFEYIPDRIIDHGIFDVFAMHPPKNVDHQLIFFVKHYHTQIPYRASCPFPIEREKYEIRYQLLPYAL